MPHIFHPSFKGTEVRLYLIFSVQLSSLAILHININEDVTFTLKEKG